MAEYKRMRVHRMSTKRYLAIVSIVSMSVVLFMTGQSFARSGLTAQQAKACEGAQTERSKLNTPERRDLLNKNPSEEAANLSREQLENLHRLIELDKQVLFKCRLIAYRDLGKRQSNRRALSSVFIPDLPIRKPATAQIEKIETITSELLPLPLRKPK